MGPQRHLTYIVFLYLALDSKGTPIFRTVALSHCQKLLSKFQMMPLLLKIVIFRSARNAATELWQADRKRGRLCATDLRHSFWRRTAHSLMVFSRPRCLCGRFGRQNNERRFSHEPPHHRQCRTQTQRCLHMQGAECGGLGLADRRSKSQWLENATRGVEMEDTLFWVGKVLVGNCLLTIILSEPPEILPFDFGKTVLDEGDFAHLSCIVTKGDIPINIRRASVASKCDTSLTLLPNSLLQFTHQKLRVNYELCHDISDYFNIYFVK